jgi:hypothetical protein
LVNFNFYNESRNFKPSTLTLDLFNGTTSFVATETKFEELNDIQYE